MKIKMVPENKVYVGKPIDIVRKMSEDVIHMNHKTVEEYLDCVLERLPQIMVNGNRFHEKAESLILGMLYFGMAKRV